MIYILFVLLIIILVASYYLSEGEICAPSFLFSGSFVFSCAWAVSYAKNWNLDLHINTFLVILSGVITFLIVSQITRVICEAGIKDYSCEKENEQIIQIKQWKLLLFIGFEIITIILYLRCLKSMTGGKSIQDAIWIYRMASTSNANTYFFPRYINYPRIIISSSSWFFSFVIVKNLTAKRKIDPLVLISFGISLGNSLLSGGRSSLITVIISLPAFFLIFHARGKKGKKQLKFYHILLIILAGFIGLQFFQRLGNLIGRNSSRDLMEYLSIYCGAEIKNLDIFVRERLHLVDNTTWGGQTFLSIVRLVKKYSGDLNFYLYFDQPHNYVNGRWIGNVATTFYSYLYDFGYKGVIILTAVMSAISEIVYEHAKRVRIGKRPPVIIIVYCMMFVILLFAFFSNWFYESFATTGFVYNIISWCLLSLFFCSED